MLDSTATLLPEEECHTFGILVDNEAGVLARVVGLFSGRGYNIDSLTVTETDHVHGRSRITIVTRGSPAIIAQIKAQIENLIPVHFVMDLTAQGESVERELALIKVAGVGDQRIEALRMADVFRAKVVDASAESFVFELTGSSSKIDRYVDLVSKLGLVEVARTGVAAVSRGPLGLSRHSDRFAD